ncbi:MAG: hypothetical protein ABIH71_03800, partial [Candidatus Omnitrophota bacterium]
MKKIVLFFLIIIFSAKNYAHDNNVIHPFTLTGKAWRLLEAKTTVDGKTPYKELNNYFYYDTSIPSGYITENWLGQTKYDWDKIEKKGTLGAIKADYPDTRTRNHFYNYLTKKGLWEINPSAIEYGKGIWDSSMDQFRYGDRTQAYYLLGEILHLLEDMSSVAHGQSDTHIVGGDDYEKWCLEHKEELLSGDQIIQPEIKNFANFMEELAEKSYYVSSFYGGELSRVKSQPVVGSGIEIGQMFPHPALKYVPIDWGLDFNYFWIENVGNWGGYTSNEWWLCEDAEGQSTGRYYIENISGINNEGVKPVEIRKDITDPNSEMISNSRILTEIYAEALVPLGINYTSGLMKYWYDVVAQLPQIEIDSWPSGVVKGNVVLSADAWVWKEGTEGMGKDVLGINKVIFEYSLDNTSWNLIGESIMPDVLNDNLWKSAWNTQEINDDSVWVRVKAKGKNGKETGWQVSEKFGVDNVSPVISIAGVSNGSSYNTSVTPTITITDINLDSSAIAIKLNEVDYVSGTEIESNGSYSLEVYAEDLAGNTSSQTISFTLSRPLTLAILFDVSKDAVPGSPGLKWAWPDYLNVVNMLTFAAYQNPEIELIFLPFSYSAKAINKIGNGISNPDIFTSANRLEAGLT